MKTLYIECNMGAAGDMLMAALLGVHPQPDAFIDQMNSLGIPGVRVSKEAAVKCGVSGTHVTVRINGAEEESQDVPPGQGQACGLQKAHPDGQDEQPDHHSGLAEIGEIVNMLAVSDKVKADVLAVYGLVAEAESQVHGHPVDAVHFHEVGMMDAVADIVGVCLLMEQLAPQQVMASAVHVGSGQVKCAHGILPVPAPATAYILQGVPIYGGQIKGELCTPTGAALLKHFVQEFGNMPLMATSAIGYGMGKKDFAVANCVRVFLGEDAQQDGDIVEIVCNLDDMTGEDLGFALQLLLENGALDVYLVPIQMKKSRPGQMLVCLAKPVDEEKMTVLMLKHTTTFGVRSSRWRRHTLARSSKTVDTPYGPLAIKSGSGFGVSKSKAEYEDLARLAKEKDKSLAEIRDGIEYPR